MTHLETRNDLLTHLRALGWPGVEQRLGANDTAAIAAGRSPTEIEWGELLAAAREASVQRRPRGLTLGVELQALAKAHRAAYMRDYLRARRVEGDPYLAAGRAAQAAYREEHRVERRQADQQRYAANAAAIRSKRTAARREDALGELLAIHKRIEDTQK